MAPRLRLTLAALATLAVVVTLLPASEPDGRTILRYAWVPGPGVGIRLLRVSVTAAVPIHGVRIRVQPPAGARAEIAGSGASNLGHGRTEKGLGDFAKGVTSDVEFYILVPATGGGIVSFRVEGTGDDGKPFSEGVGVPVGTPGAVPIVRNGAAEFPASTSPNPDH